MQAKLKEVGVNFDGKPLSVNLCLCIIGLAPYLTEPLAVTALNQLFEHAPRVCGHAKLMHMVQLVAKSADAMPAFIFNYQSLSLIHI